MLTLHQGGTLMDGSTTPPALGTPGQGAWRHTTGDNYAFRIKRFTFNAQNAFTGWSIISGELTLDAAGDAFTGGGTVEFYDPNGVLVSTSCADSVGSRFEP